jgi:hypothetical protein
MRESGGGRGSHMSTCPCMAASASGAFPALPSTASSNALASRMSSPAKRPAASVVFPLRAAVSRRLAWSRTCSALWPANGSGGANARLHGPRSDGETAGLAG